MKKIRMLTLAVFSFMLIAPMLVQLGSNSLGTNIGMTKNYIESYDHHDQIWIQSDAEFHAQAAAESWAGDGSEETPYIITGYLFDCESQPLRIWHTTVHWVFTGNVIDGVGSAVVCGTWIENVTNGAIIGNEVYNRHAGLAIAQVTNFRVANNYIHDCWGSGIEFFGEMDNTIVENNTVDNVGSAGIYSILSENSIIQDNTVSNFDVMGITLLGSSTNCTVTRNTISNSASSGIMLAQPENVKVTNNIISNVGDQGIFLTRPSYCEISNNTVSNVNGAGIGLTLSEFTNIVENDIEDCTGDGLLIGSASNTTVHWNTVSNASDYAVNLETDSECSSVKFNTFMSNGASCQVCDSGTSNTVSHNFYDDWSSPDGNSDGYVDSPYMLDGDAENQDDFPLAAAGIVPTADTTENQMPMELLLVAGSIGIIVVVAAVIFLKRR